MGNTLDTIKIEAEISTLRAETMKLHAEATKMHRERLWIPFVYATGLPAAGVGFAKIFLP